MKYKYKKHIATGALALSLLVGGSSVLAANPQDIGVKNAPSDYQRHREGAKRTKMNGRKNVVGSVSTVSSTGFTIEVKNMKTKSVTAVDVTTNTETVYGKNGVAAVAGDVVVGEKVIVSGTTDKTTGIITAKTVKIVPKAVTQTHEKAKRMSRNNKIKKTNQ